MSTPYGPEPAREPPDEYHDTDRLDWLAENAKRLMVVGYGNDKRYSFQGQGRYYDTLREAIDHDRAEDT